MREAMEALDSAEAEGEGEGLGVMLAQELCEAEPVQEGNALALREACALEEMLRLPGAVREAWEAVKGGDGEGECVDSTEREALPEADTLPLVLCEAVEEVLWHGEEEYEGDKVCDSDTVAVALCVEEALTQDEALEEAL